MESNSQIESGVRLSFYKLFSEKKYNIEIPIIQRDYAQGRQSNFDIRDNFLNVLKSYLDEGKPNRDLDFIYGSLINGKDKETTRFIPLDGQQRLTTLFLLHWYIANKEKQFDIFQQVIGESNDNNGWKSKFTYETRTSAREFCDALVSEGIDLEKLLKPDKDENNEFSKTIKNQQWYFLSWRNDPTIKGMLVMLDSIHEKFKYEEKSYYELLTRVDNPIITFQFLKLDEFGLSDDLYIKMNSRGKPLTSFENFKAKFEQQIKSKEYNSHMYHLESHKKKVKLHEYFSHKIDTEWAYLFWAYVKDDVEKLKNNSDDEKMVVSDEIAMNFFKTYGINYIASRNDTDKNIRDLLKTSSKELMYNQFSKHQCFNTESTPKLIELLNLLQNNNEKARQFIPNFYYFDENTLEKLLKYESKTAEYAERILLHGYCEYLVKWKNGDEFKDIDGLKSWMRVMHNLTENTLPYNNEREFSNSIRGINSILDNSSRILDYLISNEKIDGFDPAQIKEERVKAILIKKDNEWRDLIFEAEQHKYFKGQIGFLLRLCGIENFYDHNDKNCNWDEFQNKQFKKYFQNYYNKASLVFDDNGLKAELSKKGDYIWERALLTIGNFLIREGRNRSFLVAKDRDISWKRLLKGDKEESHPDIIKSVFDAIDFTDIKKSLKDLLVKYNGIDWKRAFIDRPELFNDLGKKRYVRKDSDHGFVLFKGERMTGAHSELYSRKFYYDFNSPINPFTKVDYYHSTGADINNLPCCFFENWKKKSYAIDIRYYKKEYEIRFWNRKPEGIEIEIVNILLSKGMSLSDKYNDISYLATMPADSDVLDFLKQLCTKFQKIIRK